MQRMFFSLVTTCRNEMRSLPRWKANVLAQDRFPDEIVVVDAFSDDGTFEFLQQWKQEDSRLILLQARGNAALGRNLAIKNARHGVILSTDMGVRLSDNWCSALIRPFEEDARTQVVAGNTCIDRETVRSVAARAEFFIENGGKPRMEPGFIIGNRSSAYRKEVWEQLKGLPEDLTFYADDSVFGRQIVEKGFVMALAPEAMTYWARPSSLKAFWKEQYNYGRGGGEAGIKMPYFYRKYRQGKLPWSLALVGNACWNLWKQSGLKALGRALRKGDVLAFLCMPLLAFGNGLYRIRGYRVGDRHGARHCLDCRSRLAGNW
jgi:cellulose synthase/poly-beta-1,6-N-acetylglucosamine synthase-like glycosyltransferase